MAELRLAQLPDRTPVKLTIAVSPDLKADLEAYAGVYEQAYGRSEPGDARELPGQRSRICARPQGASRDVVTFTIPPGEQMVTVAEFAQLARLSRRQIDRLRKRRPPGFPREYELGGGASKYRRCPRFKLAEVRRWLDSRALW